MVEPLKNVFIKEKPRNSYSAFLGLPLLLYSIKKAALVVKRSKENLLQARLLFTTPPYSTVVVGRCLNRQIGDSTSGLP